MNGAPKHYTEGEAFDASEGLLTVSEVAEKYRADPDAVRYAIGLGLVPYLRTPGGHYRLSARFHRLHLESQPEASLAP